MGAIYRILFNYFIKPAMPKEAINKIVLTIPNTYTPKHFKYGYSRLLPLCIEIFVVFVRIEIGQFGIAHQR